MRRLIIKTYDGFVILLNLFCALVLLYLIAKQVIGDSLWIVAVFDWVAPFCVIITASAWLRTIWRRQRFGAIIIGVIVLASLWNINNLWSVRGSIPANFTTEYTILTHNAGNGLANPKDLASFIRTSGADFVGLQEITASQAYWLDANLADLYPHRLLFGDGIPGKGLLSKYPIVQSERLYLYPARPDLKAIVQLPEGELTVIVAHPPPPRIHRDGIYMNKATVRQIKTLRKLATAGGPVMLLGDFNMTAISNHHASLREAGLIDAFQVSGTGFGFTLPTRWKQIPLVPMARVDYIWHTPHFEPLESWIGPSTGSDHLPVFARLGWVNTIALQTIQ
jgi:vancomycin resistance protein VanJ